MGRNRYSRVAHELNEYNYDNPIDILNCMFYCLNHTGKLALLLGTADKLWKQKEILKLIKMLIKLLRILESVWLKNNNDIKRWLKKTKAT